MHLENISGDFIADTLKPQTKACNGLDYHLIKSTVIKNPFLCFFPTRGFFISQSRCRCVKDVSTGDKPFITVTFRKDK